MKYKKIKENQWINLKSYETFNTNYYRDVDGKKFNFLDSENNFLNGKYGVNYVNSFFNRLGLDKPVMKNTNEIIVSNHKNKIRGKKILIVGGGPSAKDLDWEKKYDYIFSTNNYFKNFSNISPYLITFTPYMNLLDKDLNKFLNYNNSYIGLEPEFIKKNEIEMLKKFYPIFKDRIIVYQTRYCSAIGVSTRQAVLAVLLGASEVHLCGMDLFKDENSKKHSFENSKGLPRWRKNFGIEFQNRQVIAFWEYINKIADNKCKIKNLSEDLDYNCMSFITKETK